MTAEVKLPAVRPSYGSLLVLLALSAFSIGCSEETTCSTGSSYSIPVVTLRCTTNDVALRCRDSSPPTADAKNGWAVIIDVGTDCDTFTFSDSYYAKVQKTINCSGGICSASSGADWLDSGDAAISSLPGGNYRFCSWIDLDANDQISFDDPRTVSDQPIDSCERDFTLVGYYD